MTFAGRVVVMNGGRIEQIGRPRAKREPSPNQSVSLMVPRGGPPYPSNFNELEKVGGSLFPVGFLGFLANPPTASGRVPTLTSAIPIIVPRESAEKPNASE